MEEEKILKKQLAEIGLRWIEKDDIDYLRDFLSGIGIKDPFTDLELAKLYNRYSEEVWSASWEDNGEGLFAEWLKENNLVK